MFQSFDSKSSPEIHPPRLQALRRELTARDLDGFIDAGIRWRKKSEASA